MSRPLTLDVLVHPRRAADPWTQRLTLGGQWRACPVETWMIPAGEDVEIPDLARTVIHADDGRWFTHETHDEIIQRTAASTPSTKTLKALADALEEAKKKDAIEREVKRVEGGRKITGVIGVGATKDTWACEACQGLVVELDGVRVYEAGHCGCSTPKKPERVPMIIGVGFSDG